MGARRPSARRVPFRRCEFIKEPRSCSPCWSWPTYSACRADHELFRDRLGAACDIATTDDEWSSSNRWSSSTGGSPRTSRIGDARRDDVLSGLATATFPDGSIPDVLDVVRIATFLFAAGQETTARLLSSAQLIAENPDIQQRLRDERDRIPNFVEEVLRMESPVKSDFRMARRTTTLAGGRRRRHDGDDAQRRRQPRPTPLRMPAGVPGRPRERPSVHRARPRHPHVPWCCSPGQTRISLERIFDRIADIRISEVEHGSATASLRLRTDVHPARPQQLAPRVHTGRPRRRRGWSGTVSDYDAIDFFTDESSSPTRGQYLGLRARLPPRAARAASQRDDGHGLRRSDRGLPRHRKLLVVQLGERTVPRVPGRARG